MTSLDGSRARLIGTRVPGSPRAAVLVLHGGAARAEPAAVSQAQLSVLRMVPLAARLALAGRGRLAVFRLLNSERGWSGDRTPVDDARWALDRIRERLDGVPVGLVGHSLGGRAALLAAPEPGVRGVVALAPWVYPADGEVDARGRRILIVHGLADRIAPPQRSEAAARALARTADVGYIGVRGGNHAMLGRHAPFDRYATEFTLATLLGATVGGAVGRIMGGAERVDV